MLSASLASLLSSVTHLDCVAVHANFIACCDLPRLPASHLVSGKYTPILYHLGSTTKPALHLVWACVSGVGPLGCWPA
eukprot:1159166-Pelagomonas_calceolata.AAC.13